MSDGSRQVQLRTSPHIRVAPPVDVIMRNVVYALIPICLFSMYQFGLSVMALLATCILGCVGTEQLFCRLSKKESTVQDFSAVITGMLLALCLPPGFPLWMAAVASFVGIGIGKVFFGGLGYNVMNPALVGRAFVQAAFTVPITTWTPAMVSRRFAEFIPSTLTPPFLQPPEMGPWTAEMAMDGFTGATPLALMKFEQVGTDPVQLFLGTTAGSAGETSSLLIILCGLYLISRRMMNWRIVVSMLLTAFTVSGVFYLWNAELFPAPWFTLFTGGLMLGAMFMATDMVASPVTPMGIWIYGGLMGFITVIIRLFGGLPDGVMYAILLGNACSPLISAITQPKIYGAVKKTKPVEVA